MPNENKPLRAAIYARVSTDEQTYDNQIPYLREWAGQLRFNTAGEIARPLEIVKVYAEDASAWDAGRQVELGNLIKDAKRGLYDVVLIWALDRLTRAGILAQFEYMATFSRFGVLIYSYQEPWTLTPTRAEYDLLCAIAAYIAHSYSNRLSVNTKAGIRRKQEKEPGWKPGRPKGSKDTKPRKRRVQRA